MQKKLTLKARQTNPDYPPELIRKYQVVANVLIHYRFYEPFESSRPSFCNDDYFFRGVHKAPGFSIIDTWKKVKKSLKWWT